MSPPPVFSWLKPEIRRRDKIGRKRSHVPVSKLRDGLKVAAVKAPGFGDRRKAQLEDVAIIFTGAQVISEDLGIKRENVTLDMLGTAKSVNITKEDYHRRWCSPLGFVRQIEGIF